MEMLGLKLDDAETPLVRFYTQQIRKKSYQWSANIKRGRAVRLTTCRAVKPRWRPVINLEQITHVFSEAVTALPAMPLRLLHQLGMRLCGNFINVYTRNQWPERLLNVYANTANKLQLLGTFVLRTTRFFSNK